MRCTRIASKDCQTRTHTASTKVKSWRLKSRKSWWWLEGKWRLDRWRSWSRNCSRTTSRSFHRGAVQSLVPSWNECFGLLRCWSWVLQQTCSARVRWSLWPWLVLLAGSRGGAHPILWWVRRQSKTYSARKTCLRRIGPIQSWREVRKSRRSRCMSTRCYQAVSYTHSSRLPMATYPMRNACSFFLYQLATTSMNIGEIPLSSIPRKNLCAYKVRKSLHWVVRSKVSPQIVTSADATRSTGYLCAKYIAGYAPKMKPR